MLTVEHKAGLLRRPLMFPLISKTHDMAAKALLLLLENLGTLCEYISNANLVWPRVI